MIGSTTLSANFSQITGSVSMARSTINAITSYTFTILTYDTITASGRITIAIPPEVGTLNIT
jgi:hypothetical protein